MEDDTDMYRFLQETGVDNSIIERMKEEKITKHVINLMDDHSLSTFIPKVGDRLLLKEICQAKEKKNKKDSLFTILKKKMKTSEENCSSSTSSGTRKVSNATKNTRKIQLGWMHEGKVLRMQSGGGTRKLEMNKNCTNKDICEVGKGLFIKNGKSIHGKQDEMNFSIMDFQKVPMPDGVTIGEVHEIAKLDGMVKFYMCTIKKSNKQKSESYESDDEVIIGKRLPSCSTPKVSTLDVTVPLQRLDQSKNGSSESLPSLEYSPKYSRRQLKRQDILAEAVAIAGIENDSDQTMDDQSDNAAAISATMSVIVRRGNIFKDMISYFKGINIVGNQKCEVKITLPNGETEVAEDNGGVFRDALSEFWDTFFASCTDGESVRVPITIHHMMQQEWAAVAKVVYFGYTQEGLFPIQLAKPFMMYCYRGENSPESDLINSFLNYMPDIDRETIQSVLSNGFSDVDRKEVDDIISSLGGTTMVNEENFKDVLYELAHKAIIQDSAFVADCWRPIFRTHLADLFKHKLSKLYEDLIPSVRKVINVMAFPDDMSREQEKTTQYLTKFVKGLKPEMLERFLRFCTGSMLFLGKNIVVSFYREENEFARRPIGHTCGCVLELPFSYRNFTEFRTEFSNVLDSKVWIMDII